MPEGLTGRPISRMPRAIAPEVTSTTSSPAACLVATSAQRGSSTSSRTCPTSSATMVEPSFTTTVAMPLPHAAGGEAPVPALLLQAEHLRPGLPLLLERGGHGGLVAVDRRLLDLRQAHVRRPGRLDLA